MDDQSFLATAILLILLGLGLLYLGGWKKTSSLEEPRPVYSYPADTNWPHPWKPWGKCQRTGCMYNSVRCEYGLCQVCCGLLHRTIPKHIRPAVWSAGDNGISHLPAIYQPGGPREPRLGSMEEVTESEKHTSYQYTDDKWFNI